MAANLWKTGTSNAFNTTLNGNVLAGDSSITLTSVTGLQSPGVLVLDRQDVVSGTDTPTLREYISFTGISGNAVTGCTRGLGGSTGQAHSSGAKVEEVFTITHWNDLISAIENVLTSAGALDTTKVVDLTTAQTLTNKTLTSPSVDSPAFSGTATGKLITAAIVPTLTTDTYGTTVTFNMNTSNTHIVTLTGSPTLAVSNVTSGQCFMVHLKQGSSGGPFTVTWWSGILWNQGVTPTLSTAANAIDSFGFQYDGTNYYGYIVGQNLS